MQSKSPGGSTLGTPLTGSSPLHQRRHLHIEMKDVVTRTDSEARSFEDRKASNRFNTLNLATIAIRSVPSELE